MSTNKSVKPKTEIVKLEDNELCVYRDGNGKLGRVYSKQITLRDGMHYNKISGKNMLNADGLIKLNQFANINILSPNTIIMDGIEKPNPCIERDSEGVISAVHVRSYAFGFSPTGNPVMVQKSLTLDLHNYLVQDLQARILRFPACGCVGTKDAKPKSWQSVVEKWSGGKKSYESGPEIKPRENANLRFIPTAGRVGDDVIGIWYDLSHPEIIAVFNEAQRRRQFVDRTAKTFCERNALKSHPAIAMSIIPPELIDENNKTAQVKVYGYKHDLTIDQLHRIKDVAAQGDINLIENIAGASIEIVPDSGPEEMSYDEMAAGTEEVAAEEAAITQKPSQRPPSSQQADIPLPEDDSLFSKNSLDPGYESQQQAQPEERTYRDQLKAAVETYGEGIINTIVANLYKVKPYSLLTEEGHCKRVLSELEKMEASKG